MHFEGEVEERRVWMVGVGKRAEPRTVVPTDVRQIMLPAVSICVALRFHRPSCQELRKLGSNNGWTVNWTRKGQDIRSIQKEASIEHRTTAARSPNIGMKDQG